MSLSNPLVTVLMPVYNGEKFLNDAITSILNQTFQDFEFLIINDGSTDNSLDCINSFSDHRIKVITNKKNIGLVRTLNKGLKYASGKYIARFDQDDISLIERLEDQLKFLETNKQYSAVCSWMVTINSKGEKIHYFNQEINNYGDFLGYILTGKTPLYHPAVMYRKDDIISINGYDTGFPMAEDFDLWRRMALNKFNATFINKYHLLQRQHNNNATKIDLKKYLDAGYRVQTETIEIFSKIKNKNNLCLSALLRLSPDPCGKKFEKNHLRELIGHLENNIIQNIIINNDLSLEEIKTLKNRIYKRLGLSVRHIKYLSNLPNAIYFPLLIIFSPLLIPNVYSSLFKIYRKIQKIRLKFNIN